VHQILNRSQLKTEHFKTVESIDQIEWNNLFGERGSFDWGGLKFLEESFSGNQLPEDNWDFDYLIIRDNSGKSVLATFLTTALWKDDMLSPAEISLQVEDMRKTDPYYLTSKVISLGSLLTEGNHLTWTGNLPFGKRLCSYCLQNYQNCRKNIKQVI